MAYRELGFGGRDLLASVERERGRAGSSKDHDCGLLSSVGKEKGNG